MSLPDLFTNQIGKTLVIAPTDTGRLNSLSNSKTVAFKRDGDVTSKGLTRWVFADLDRLTLTDRWNNPYDHEAHSLLSGTLSEGQSFLKSLKEADLIVMDHDDFFVPFQTLDINSQTTSDALRSNHPRAFALARREAPSLNHILTLLRDSSVI
jgi:hypothetical protein